MSKLPRVTATELIRALNRDGWHELRQQSGSHVILGHASKSGLLIIPMHKGKALRTGLIAKTLKDAGLTSDDLRRLL
ncbi:MAG: type II toxin-antitoxin system HicA family toxin [Chloroflexota bacterium]|jgi:predicted RNA binding protein YcfA (HicA-like mRNA interferase family)